MYRRAIGTREKVWGNSGQKRSSVLHTMKRAHRTVHRGTSEAFETEFHSPFSPVTPLPRKPLCLRVIPVPAPCELLSRAAVDKDSPIVRCELDVNRNKKFPNFERLDL